jgi:DNA-binding response OmpR family regulator
MQAERLGSGEGFRYTKTVKVYIVDDASFIRMICRYHLTKAGHQIIGESHEGDTALIEILAMQPDCVLVDLSLPQKSGAEIMQEVQQKYPQIQFIVVSALDEDILKATAPDVGYASYIRKPFEASDLMSAVEKVEKSLVRQKHG